MNRILTIIIAMLVLSQETARAQDHSKNYVMTEMMLDDTGTNSIKTVQYYNGLGYPTVSVATTGGNGETSSTMTTYDGLGRESKKYLPVPGNGLNYFTEQDFRTRGAYYQDASAYTQTHYDALDRVTAIDMAGDKWRTAGKQERTEHLINTASDMVLHYEAPADGSYSLREPQNTSFTYYPAGTLNKIVSYDADNKSITVFEDFRGKKILERTAAGDTYYVFNNLNQLRFVLMPEYQNNSDKAINAYEYRYDNRGRVVKKYLPKCGAIQYWYDKADRVAYMKDPALGNKYRFYLYDKLGRLCLQGTCSNACKVDTTYAATAYQAGSSGVCNTGYAAPYKVDSPQIEIVNYYDNYDFIGKNFTTTMPTVSINENQRQYSIGFQTGSVVYATNGEALCSINVYDIKGQVVRSVRKGLGGFTEDVCTAYTFTGAIENTVANVNVKYGSSFTATTDYAYSYGKKKKMTLAVSHGMTPLSRATDYCYDAIGRLTNKYRYLTNTVKLGCTYSYDVHGWLTKISSGGFEECLYYADGLDGGCYNGNISTMKWRPGGDIYSGYNLKYDDSNRLSSAVFGSGDNLGSNRNYFNESVEYDGNGNITRLKRGGLVDKMHGGFGLVDNLYMTYDGNQLVSVRDDAPQLAYTGATDFNGVRYREYPLSYNASGSLVSDAGRKIARIDYDNMNNPIRIQFMDGNVTKYIYSATGEKLRVIYITAVPNISVPIGSIKELSPSEILCKDSIDYLLGGNLTLRNGRIDKYLFEEGYCQAEAYSSTKDRFTFCYYDRDHLGSVRQVTEADGSKNGYVIQTANYYPFGGELCQGDTKNSIQSHKYNGKEFDNMYGLNTYDYGARQYNPVTGRWDRMDQLCEKYYPTSPFAYCRNNPVLRIDVNGLYDTINVHRNENYPVIVFLPSDLEDQAAKKDYEAAKNAGMPIVQVESVEDMADALSDLDNQDTSFDCVSLNSHGSQNGFYIGNDAVTSSSNLIPVSNLLCGKTLMINACNVGNNASLVESISFLTDSRVIAPKHKIYAGYKYDGSLRLNRSKGTDRDKFLMSNNGVTKVVRDVTIHKKNGVKWK